LVSPHARRFAAGYRPEGVKQLGDFLNSDLDGIIDCRSWPIHVRSIPAADLIDVLEKVGRVFVDATGASALELLSAVAAAQEADAEGTGALGYIAVMVIGAREWARRRVASTQSMTIDPYVLHNNARIQNMLFEEIEDIAFLFPARR
jgi:hypothetical protein